MNSWKSWESARNDLSTLASIILDEIDSEKRWDIQFAGSQETLVTLADEAVAEFNEGKTPLLKND